MKTFQRKVAEVESQIMTREEKGLVRDPTLDVAYQDLEDLRDGLIQAQEKMFEVSLYITLYGNTTEELDKAENEIKNILESKIVYVKPALFQQDTGFLSTLPVGQDLLGIKNKLNTSPLSSFFPFVSFDLSSDKGILYGLNRHNGSLVLFDRYSLENYNSIVFAKSGSGKSYFTKLEILRTLMFETEVIIIDPEREYEFLAESVGGRYFDISLVGNHHINPFDLPHPTQDESPSEVLRSNIVNLVGLFRVMLGGLTPEEDAIIDQAITETYALKDINGANDIINLGMAEIYLTLMINDIGSQPFSAKTLPPLQRPAITFRNDAIEWSRSAYAHPKEEVEKNIRDWYADGQDELKALEEQAKNKKKITFADGTAPQPYTPRPKFAPVSVGAPAQGFVKKQFTPKQAPDTHKPFTKAFAKPTTQTGVIKETQQVTHTHEVTVKASPELKGLLDAIDGTATPVEVVTPEQKPSREPTLPVKHAERGPTEKNRDLLKAALQQAMKDAPMPTSSPVSAPPTADRVTENLTSNQVSPNTAEVSPDDLRKVLE
jgi:hypothetical protein